MKVCIIGNGLTSLTLAKALVNQDIFVDIIYQNNLKHYSQNRTIGISKSNIEYFTKNISNIKKILWKIKNIKIFTENSKDDEIINFSDSDKSLFFLLQNDHLYKQLNSELQNNKFFNYKKNINYINLIKKDYKLIINCDSNHEITKKFFSKKIEKKYNSFAYTTIIEHKKLMSNSIATQIFTNNGPIAFLPISNNKTSVVYSLRSKSKINKKDIINLIKKFNFQYEIKKINDLSEFEIKSLNLRKYHFTNILAFGDLLHKVHPLAGQGFNMTLRDIKELISLIIKKKEIGLDIDSSICAEFERITKSNNLIFSSGIDLIYEFFHFESKFNNKILSKSVKKILKNKSFNRIFKKFADIGIAI